MKAVTNIWVILITLIVSTFSNQASEIDSTNINTTIDIGDLSLHIECYGKGQSTAIVHSGFNGYGSSGGWHKVVSLVKDKMRICLYDRANLGKSDNQEKAYNFEEAVIQLHTLLAKAEISPPFIMVGHSYGSYPVRLYNHFYPTEVAGILLVDPSQYGQWHNKIAKWRIKSESYSDKHLNHLKEELAYWENPFHNPEKLDIKQNEALITNSSNFGDKPYVLLWAKGSDKMSDAPSNYWQGAEPVWFRMKAMFDQAIADMGQLSTNTKVVYANTNKHNVYYHDPETVVEQLLYLAKASQQKVNQ